MCVISCILKMLISIVNSLLMIMGLALMVLGALLLWGMNSILKGVFNLQTEMQKFFGFLGVKFDISGVISLIQQNSSTIGAAGFAIGVILVAIAVFGIIAVCCCSLKKILIVICILLIIITLGLIILIAYFGVNKASQVFQPIVNFAQKKLIDKYQDINSTEPESIIINILQSAAHCCGLYNYSDFNTAVNFNRKAFDSKNQEYTLLFPLSCCNYVDMTITKESRDSCIQNRTSDAMNNGCYSSISPQLEKYLGYAFVTVGITIGVLLGTIAVTVVLIICADKLE